MSKSIETVVCDRGGVVCDRGELNSSFIQPYQICEAPENEDRDKSCSGVIEAEKLWNGRNLVQYLLLNHDKAVMFSKSGQIVATSC